MDPILVRYIIGRWYGTRVRCTARGTRGAGQQLKQISLTLGDVYVDQLDYM